MIRSSQASSTITVSTGTSLGLYKLLILVDLYNQIPHLMLTDFIVTVTIIILYYVAIGYNNLLVNHLPL